MTVWIIFIGFIILCLALDLGVFNRKAHVIKPKEAAVWTSVWVGLALLFSGVIYYLFSNESVANPTNLTANEAFIAYITGYLVELSLSIDNVFVIAVIFSSFKIPAKYQHRVLFWGILGAIVFRAIMIIFGVALINRFDWMIYVFGAFLLYTGFSMLKNDDDFDPHDTWLFKKMSKMFPITNEIDGDNFFIRKGAKNFATPLFMALIVIELTDVFFALDSIPAILAITQNEFIVFSSNILAILGLRSMFFLIVGMLEKFRYINYSLAVILGFVGIKMLLIDYFHIPPLVSLGIIALALAGGILASIYIKPHGAEAEKLREIGDQQEEEIEEIAEKEEREKDY
ncbi:MAG TPA: TerC family protein [Salinimicrobium sp.]|nr:TerC family protein [Salinimicrobium sp.]